MIEYIKTEDPNIFKENKTSSKNILLDEIEQEVLNLQKQMDDIPEVKTKPDIETLNYYNENIEMGFQKEALERELSEKQELVSTLKSLRVMELK